MWIFRVTLEVSTGQGVAVQVEGGAEDQAGALAPGLLGQGPAHGFDEGLVPGRGQGRAHWKTRGGGAAAAVAPDPVGPVAQLEGRDSQADTGVVCHGPDPAQSETFSSRVRAASS